VSDGKERNVSVIVAEDVLIRVIKYKPAFPYKDVVLNTIINLILKTKKTRRVVVVFDSISPLHKTKEYPTYRRGASDKLQFKWEAIYHENRCEVLEYVYETLIEMGFHNIFKIEGYEGKDIVAHLTGRYPFERFHIASDDKMYYMLLDTDLFIHRFTAIYGIKKVTPSSLYYMYGIYEDDYKMIYPIAGSREYRIQGLYNKKEDLVYDMVRDYSFTKVFKDNAVKLSYEKNFNAFHFPYKGFNTKLSIRRIRCCKSTVLSYIRKNPNVIADRNVSAIYEYYYKGKYYD
jgi:hypothetical protein